MGRVIYNPFSSKMYEEQYQLVKMAKVPLQRSSFDDIINFFAPETERDMGWDMDSFLQKLSPHQMQLLQMFDRKIHVFYLADVGDFDDGFKTTIYPSSREEDSAQKLPQRRSGVLVLVGNRQRQEDLYCGFIEGAQKMATTQRYMGVTLMHRQQETLSPCPLNLHDFFTYLRQKIGDLYNHDQEDEGSFLDPDMESSSTRWEAEEPLPAPDIRSSSIRQEDEEPLANPDTESQSTRWEAEEPLSAPDIGSSSMRLEGEQLLVAESGPLNSSSHEKCSILSDRKQLSKLLKPQDYISPSDSEYKSWGQFSQNYSRLSMSPAVSKYSDRFEPKLASHLLQGAFKHAVRDVSGFQAYLSKKITEKNRQNEPGSQNRVCEDPDLHAQSYREVSHIIPIAPREDEFFGNELSAEVEDLASVNDNNISDNSSQSQIDNLKTQKDNQAPEEGEIVFPLHSKQEDQEVRVVEQLITKQLQKKALRRRNVKQMAVNFVKLRLQRGITASTTKEKLKSLGIGVGGRYAQVLHPLFMRLLKQQRSNQNANFMEGILKEYIQKVRDGLVRGDLYLPSILTPKKLFIPLSLEGFCQFANRKQTVSGCWHVNVELEEGMKVKTISKFCKTGGFLYVHIEDFEHNFDVHSFVHNPKVELSKEIREKIRESRVKSQRKGTVHYKPQSPDKICSMIEKSIVEFDEDYFTGFCKIKVLDKQPVIMVNVVKTDVQEVFNEYKVSQIRLKLMAGTDAWDTVHLYQFKYQDRELN